MSKENQIKKLEAQRDRIENQLSGLKSNRLITIGKRWGRKLAHKFHKHSFSEWKKNYVVLRRSDYVQLKRQVGFYQAKYRDAMLRNNNRNVRF